jgi:glucokinase
VTTQSGGQGPLLLAGDVGGTKTDVVVVSAADGPRQPLVQRRYPSADYSSLSELAGSFLEQVGMRVDAVCFDVAGPVVDGKVRLTNLPWEIDESSLASALSVRRARLLNDLAATASAVPLLTPEELHSVKPGEALRGTAIAVLAPGTGLGEAFLTPEAGGYQPNASEGGHAAFSPTSELELELLRYLWGKFDHVSVERVASGVGIPNLYDFLRDERGVPESERLAEQLAATHDRTRPIVQAALAPEPDPLADATLALFLGILGTEAANLALKVLALGGVYLAGGIAQALRDVLGTPPFVGAFTKAGRFRAMLERIPVHVVMGDVALLGVASEGLKLFAGSPAAAS